MVITHCVYEYSVMPYTLNIYNKMLDKQSSARIVGTSSVSN